MLIPLNNDWRTTDDGCQQWVIQRCAGKRVRVSKAGPTRGPWDARYFFDARGLLISVATQFEIG